MAAAQPYSYSGQGFSLQGDKGRFVLPSGFRKTVRESSYGAKTLCLAKHDRWNCLTGFGLTRRDGFEAQLDREEALAAQTGKDYDRELRSLQLYGFFEVPFDDSGRFVLPEHLAKLSGIDERLYFQAAGAFFTVWSPAELAKMGGGWESAQAACASLEAEALSKVRKA